MGAKGVANLSVKKKGNRGAETTAGTETKAGITERADRKMTFPTGIQVQHQKAGKPD